MVFYSEINIQKNSFVNFILCQLCYKTLHLVMKLDLKTNGISKVLQIKFNQIKTDINSKLTGYLFKNWKGL